MAGDLYIDDLTYDERKMLTDLGATIGDSIFHSDKDYYGNRAKLLTQLNNAAKQDRTDLPAHAYISLNKNMNIFCAAEADMKIDKARLAKFFAKCKRPKGVVSGAAHLASWPDNGWTLTENDPFAPFVAMQAALIKGNVTIEYYVYDGKPLLTVFPQPPANVGGSGWTYVPE